MSVVEVVASVLLLSGGLLTVVAAAGLLRLPDPLARLQAATKPQVLGLVLVMGGVLPLVGETAAQVNLALVVAFQLVTAPVLAQLLARAAYRAGVVPAERLVVDELAGEAITADPPATETSPAEPADGEEERDS